MPSRHYGTQWLWCILAITGPTLGSVGGEKVRTPPQNPTTIEAQAKFFQDFFSVQLSPYKIEFGHVCEDPNTWEQRYEKKDFKNHRDMGKCDFRYRHLPTHEDYDQGHRLGSENHFTERHERARPSDGLFSAKVRWGDKQGGYGEHYWDLNHAGHAGNHGNDEYGSDSDDGSYNHDDDHSHDAYDEPSEQVPTYGSEEYDPEKAAQYDEAGRAKRAHPRIKSERKLLREEYKYDEEAKPQKQKKKAKENIETAATQFTVNVPDDVTKSDYQQPPKKRRIQQKRKHVPKEKTEVPQVTEDSDDEEEKQSSEESQQQEQLHQYEQQHQAEHPQYEQELDQHQQQQYLPRRYNEPNHFVPYEHGSGIRQHQPEVTAAASAPRLFLEPTTGRIVDRATGQAYILQPITGNNYH